MRRTGRRSGAWWIVAALVAGATAAAVAQDETILIDEPARVVTDADTVIGELPPNEFVPDVIPATEGVFLGPASPEFGGAGLSGASDGLSAMGEGLVGCTAANCGGIAEDYWLFDVIFFQRDNQSTDQILAASGGNALITTGEPQFTVQPGIRLFRGRIDDCGRGWEVGYLGVWNMFANLEEGGPATIQGGDPLSLAVDGFNDRSLARATYASTLNTAEANLLLRSCHRGFSRVSAYPWERCGNYRRGTIDWLAGFRWAGLDEAAGIEYSGGGFPGQPFPGPSSYNVRSTTNFFGAQIGGRGRMEWDRWAIDGWAKAALAGTAMSQSADPIVSVSNPLDQIRPASSATEGGVGFIGDININLSYRINDAWRLRTGYNFLWLTGVALAPNQFDFGGSPSSGTGLAGGAGVFLHGANLGLETAW
jgi:hypothetical protein